MQITIRQAQDEDADELEILFQTTRQETFVSRPPNEFKIGDFKKSTEGEAVWVAVNNGQIVGFVSLFMPHFVHNLFIYEPFQHQGIGTSLLQKAEEVLTHPMELKIAMDNMKACSFYEKQGWHQVSIHADTSEPYFLYRK
jgi:GNAT superfamily N-acetyltransferase